ncbi:MAG: DUF2975 domain-containing protein [Legionellaceae bacterium]|nr:DUF2975 domain-containing protein [Legionellaceae bacterium]
MNKIKSTSRALSLFFFIACCVYPLINLYVAINDLPTLMNWTFLPIDQLSHFSLTHRLIIVVLSYIPIAFTVMICFQLAQLFRLYEKKIFFERENIQRIHCIGKYMLIGQLVQCILYQPVMMWVLTCMQPVGQRSIMLGFGTTNLSTLATGVIIIVASWIATEANQLKKDVQLTI